MVEHYPEPVTDYIATLREPERGAVAATVAAARKLVPGTTEGTSYGMPALMLHGKALLAVVVRKNWIAAYPYSGKAVASAAPHLAGFDTTSGSVHFTAAHPLPDAALETLLKARAAEISNAKR